MKPFHSVCVVLCAATITLKAAAQTPLGTTFTYQGKLENTGQPASGLHDLRFQMFTLAAGGTQVGSTICVDGVDVVDGLFTASLDFGAAFDGDQRFLQVSVRADGTPGNCASGTYTMLTPRQPLTAVPYALYALTGPGSGGPWTVSGNNIFNTNTGNVGIGTTTPQSKLHVVAPTGGATPGEGIRVHGIASGVGNQSYMSFTNSSGTRTGYVGDGSTGDNAIFLNADSGDIVLNTAAGRAVNVKSDGNVGIGTTTPGARLGIETNGPGSVLIGGQNTGSGGRTILQLAVSAASNGYSHLQSITASGVDWGTLALQPFGGNVAIGTTVAHTPLTFANTGGPKISLWGNGPQVYGFGMNVPASLMQIYTPDPSGDIAFGHGTSANFTENMRITGSGTTRVKVLEITGADLAEKFPASETLEPGMVVAIDAKNAGKLCLSRGAYNRCVAGVVSGANNFSVGAVLGNLPGHEDAPPLALSGRVYVHCDASTGAIEPGDMLTTSETPGYAMKAADANRLPGAVIGKAMEPLPAGKQGLVLVLVNLQ